MEDEKDPIEEEDEATEEPGTMKQWFQDNLRIIVSILIVVAIAGGIYSYSKRTEAPTTGEEVAQSSIISEEQGNQANPGTEQGVTDNEAATQNTGDQQASTPAKTTPAKTTPAPQVAASQETENSFVETAAKGDGMTKLARRALANYLEKNPDSTLTAEHKIYIEDFLRKNVAKKSVRIGTSVEFSKSLIQNAITKAKTLNEGQLKNLHKYAVRVPSLS